MKRWMAAAAVGVVLVGGGGYFWRQHQLHQPPSLFASANGRIEAQQIDIAAKLPGRLAEVGPREGDMVDAGAVLARLQDTELRAQLAHAEASIAQAQKAVAQAAAESASRASALKFAQQETQRTAALIQRGFASGEKLDERRSQERQADAALQAAQAAEQAAQAAVTAAQAQRQAAQSQLDDTVITAPVRGRVEYRLAQPGEVVGAGGRLLTLLDLTDVSMTIFLPAAQAAKLSLGDEARLILDPVPQYVIPAKVTFVASEAQFTPKSVETRDEREKLMFRVKLTLPPDLLLRHEDRVKAGVRGVGHVRLSPDAAWPEALAVKLP